MASGYKLVKKNCGLQKTTCRHSGDSAWCKFIKRPGQGDQIKLWPLASVLLFLLLPHLFVSLFSVISNQNISNSSPAPESSAGQTYGKSARSPAVRRICFFTRQKKMGHHYTTDSCNSLEEGRHVSRGRCYFPLMWWSHLNKTLKKNKDNFSCVIFRM